LTWFPSKSGHFTLSPALLAQVDLPQLLAKIKPEGWPWRLKTGKMQNFILSTKEIERLFYFLV